MPRNSEHESTNGIGRPPAVVEQVLPVFISMNRDVLAKRAQQIFEQLHGEIAAPNRVRNRHKNKVSIVRGTSRD